MVATLRHVLWLMNEKITFHLPRLEKTPVPTADEMHTKSSTFEDTKETSKRTMILALFLQSGAAACRVKWDSVPSCRSPQGANPLEGLRKLSARNMLAAVTRGSASSPAPAPAPGGLLRSERS